MLYLSFVIIKDVFVYLGSIIVEFGGVMVLGIFIILDGFDGLRSFFENSVIYLDGKRDVLGGIMGCYSWD